MSEGFLPVAVRVGDGNAQFVYRLDEGDAWAQLDGYRIIIAKADGKLLVLSPPGYDQHGLHTVETDVDRDLFIKLSSSPRSPLG